VYWFARSADDLADEGSASAEERLAALNMYEQGLKFIERDELTELANRGASRELQQGFLRLAQVFKQYPVSTEPFHALLSAFRQDVTFRPLASEADLLDYCSRSANPVGRIVLALFQQAEASYWESADAICSSLQLINFLQDLRPDAARGRLYIPLDCLAKAGFSSSEWLTALRSAEPMAPNQDWQLRAQALIANEHARAQALLARGPQLVRLLKMASKTKHASPGLYRLALELRATIAGGQCILDKIARSRFDPFAARPKVNAGDWIKIALTTFFSRA
jgi:squalene synthase HpnC